MIRTVITLLAHDLAVAFKNKTLALVVCIPLLVYATLALVDSSDARAAAVNVALHQTGSYAPDALAGIMAAPDLFAVRWVSSEEEATRLLKGREVDGILVPDARETSRLVLTVLQPSSAGTLALVQRLSALQDAAEGRGPGWIADVRPLQAGSVKRQTLPTWILMMVLIIGFMVLPAQVAEEKEKQWLLGLMQTPVRESEWLLSKLAYGIVLTLVSAVALQGLAGESAGAYGARYLGLLCAGGFCFGALGIGLGLLCRSQASARTLGLLCYLPMLLPAALSDMSGAMLRVAPLVPSFHFYEPVRVLLLEAGEGGAPARACAVLVVIGLLACLASHRLIRKRWLMA